MNIRDKLEEIERKILSPKATLSANSRGRERPETPHSFRTAFQRDRDRIIHSKSFRRLKHKTQVFLAPFGTIIPLNFIFFFILIYYFLFGNSSKSI